MLDECPKLGSFHMCPICSEYRTSRMLRYVPNWGRLKETIENNQELCVTCPNYIRCLTAEVSSDLR
jgi:hypothetical protein